MKVRRPTWAANPKRAVAYLRVSTDRETQALGIQAQRTAIESWSKRDGVEVCAWLDEEVSGGASLEKRPILLRAIAALGDHGAGLLVVQRLDRFSRDPFTAAMAEIELVKFGARVVTADGVGNGNDPGSRLMKDVALAAARFERSMIAARTKAALAVKKARRECTGTPPYGWCVGENGQLLVENAQEQLTLLRLRELRSRGWSYRQIQSESKRLGIASRSGLAFTLQAIFAMTKGIIGGFEPRGLMGEAPRSRMPVSSRVALSAKSRLIQQQGCGCGRHAPAQHTGTFCKQGEFEDSGGQVKQGNQKG